MVNNVVIQGRLCFDIEVKEGKTPYLQNRLAIQGFKEEDTVFIGIKVFGKTAEVMEEYCKKGSQIIVTGRLTQFENKDGDTVISVTADKVDIIFDSNKDDDKKKKSKRRREEDEDEDDDEDNGRSKKRSKKRRGDDDDDDDEPRKKSRRRKKYSEDDDDDDEEDY